MQKTKIAVITHEIPHSRDKKNVYILFTIRCTVLTKFKIFLHGNTSNQYHDVNQTKKKVVFNSQINTPTAVKRNSDCSPRPEALK